jgi:hypothetical protein
MDRAVTGRAELGDAGLGRLAPDDVGQWPSTAALKAVMRVAPHTNPRPLRAGAPPFVVEAVGTARPT